MRNLESIWKRCAGIGVLVLMTALAVKTGTEQEMYPQQAQQSGQDQQVQSDLPEQKRQTQQKPCTVQNMQIGEDSAGQNYGAALYNSMAENMPDEDTDLYVQCLQNLHQGNNMVYADGYYYFRSQVENYSLCRTEGSGMPVEVVADQVPGAIYVREDQVYFINVSDNRTLYAVGTDGNGLRKLSDFPMQELVVVEDRVYFRSVYDREYDPFYQLVEEDAEDDRYLYSMKLDGSDCRLLIPRICLKFTTDGKRL